MKPLASPGTASLLVLFLGVAACGGTVVFESSSGGEGGSGGEGASTTTTAGTTGNTTVSGEVASSVDAASTGVGPGTVTGSGTDSAGVGGGAAVAEAVCEGFCACTQCDDDERVDCLDDVEEGVAEAQAAGCDTPLGAYVDCLLHDLVCVNGQIDPDTCDDEAEALDDCMD